jgi:predicted thioesterase
MGESRISAGMALEVSQEVTTERSAPHVGSGALSVYATPAMAAFIEQACCQLVEALLPDGKTTVGVEISIKHLAPTPVGKTVHARVEVVSTDGSLIGFRAQVHDDVELIGIAEHRRAIVDIDRFLKRVGRKTGTEAKNSGGNK